MSRSKAKPTDTEQAAPLTSGVSQPPAPTPVPEASALVSVVVGELPPIAPLPDVSEEIFDAPDYVQSPTVGGNTSPTGETWDPSVHEDPPRLAARGSWAKRRGGARRGSGVNAGHAHAPRTAATPGETVTPEAMNTKVEQTATLCAGLVFMTGEMLIGECMKPDASERAGITEAFKDFCRSYDIIDIPPWLGLVGALGIYGARRWNHPDVVALRRKMRSDEKETV